MQIWKKVMNMPEITMGSLFDGVGGFPLGATMNGITPVWASEIEPFPIRVTTKRIPHMKHYGDICRVDGSKIEPVDIITFGFCCQDLSLAGKRAGLDGSRSSLFFEAVRIVREMKEATGGDYPKFLVAENVPGLLSSSLGKDYIRVMDELSELGFVCDPNLLNAQYMGVPQRRRRVYITCVSINYILEKKTVLSLQIITKWLAEVLHMLLAEILTASNADVRILGLETEQVEGGLGKRLRLFSVDGREQFQELLSIWEEMYLSFAKKPVDWNAEIIKTLQNTEQDQASMFCKGEVKSAEESWNNIMDAVCNPGNISDILIHSKEKTELITSVFTALMYILLHIKHSEQLYEDLSETVQLFLKMTERSMNLNARRHYGKGIEKVEWNDIFDINIKRLYRMSEQIERHTGGTGASKILSEHKGMSRYSSQGRGSGKGTSTNAKNSVRNPISIGTPISFEPGALSRLGGHYSVEQTCTLRAEMGDNRVCIAIENHPAASRLKLDITGTVQTLTNRMGTGGCNGPMLFKGIPKAYGICSDKSNSMLSSNSKSGIYEADTSRTLDANGGNPSCNQGGVAIVESYSLQGSIIGRKDENGPQGSGINKDVSFTIDATNTHAVVYALDRASYNQGENAKFDISIQDDETTQTIVAKGPGAVASFYPQMKAESQCYREDGTANTLVNGTNPGFQNGIVGPEYTVRRLTPTECASLQGFSREWCSGLETENPTEDEILFWAEVFETHRRIMGTSKHPKSRNQIIKWLKDPYSDGVAYKAWGNGVALPCVNFVMLGIADVMRNS